MTKKMLSVDIEDLLTESSTVHQLKSNTKVFFGPERERKAGQVQLTNVEYVPAVANGMLIVKSKTRSSDKTYETTIQFSKVKFVKPDTQYAVPVATGQEEMHIMPLKARENDVQVHCTCMDFYWRFAMHNDQNDSLIGKPPAPYVKKTDRPPLNPDRVPGACKHIDKLTQYLSMERILKQA